MHLAAESHVDRSIDGPAAFIQTNVVGTFTLLEAARAYWSALPADAARGVPLPPRLDRRGVRRARRGRSRRSPRPRAYDPRSPYSASKAASDHLVRAWHHTYGLPAIVSNTDEQLRPVAIPREADPAGHAERAGGQAAAGLRRRLQPARLAVRRRPRRGAGAGAGARRAGRHLRHRRAPAAQQPRRGAAPSAPHLDAPAARPGRPARAADPLRHRPARPRFPLRDRPVAHRGGARLAGAARFRAPACARTIDWYLDNRAWWEGVRAGRYAGQRLGRREAAADEGHPARRRLRHAAAPDDAGGVASSCCRSTTSR